MYVSTSAHKKEESTLIGKTIFIDAGHGGKDDGASADGVLEDYINLKISGYLYEALIDSGAYVLVSRTSDYDLASMYQKNRKREDLKNRVKYINASKTDLFISIHLNAYKTDSVNGAQVFFQDNIKSNLLATHIQNQLNKITKKERKIKKGDYYILNNSTRVGVLVECGFLSNELERKKLNTEEYQRQIAKMIKKGIVDFFNS